MKLNSLKLKNYRQFENAEIEFADGVIGIIGLNGVGKSTIVEAIAWTLYGNLAARTDKEGIKRVSAAINASTQTTLEIEIGGIPFQITRELKGQNQTGNASIISQGKIIAESVRGADEEINYLLGMDYKSFSTSFFAKQKELNALSDLTPNQRKDVIIRMLRIDAVDRVVDRIRSQTREAKLEAELLRKNLKDENILIRDQQLKTNALSKYEAEFSTLEKNCIKLEEELEKYRKQFLEERKIYEQFNKLDKEIAQIKARLTGLIKRKEELSEELKEIKQLEIKFEAIEKDAKEYEMLESEEKELSIAKRAGEKTKETRLKEIEAREKALKPGLPCPTCGQEIKDFEAIKKHLKEEKEQIAKEAPYNKEEHDRIIKLLQSKKAAFLEYPKLAARLERKTLLTKELQKISDENDNFENNLNHLTSEQKNVPYDEKRHAKITAEHDEIKIKLDASNKKHNTCNLEIVSLKKEIEAIENEIQNRHVAESKIKELVNNQEKKNKLAQIMVEYRTHLISRIRPQLSEIAGNLFCELTNGKYSGIELDENYEMFIYDGGIKYALPRFSGGEADLANLCLRLAISELISGRTNIEGGFLILDEIFGSQDIIRKNAILQALAQLSKRFRQIILITHVDDIRDSLGSIIEVQENESGISQIKQTT